MAISTNKNHAENSDEGRKAKSDAQNADSTTAEVQRVADEETEKGYRGLPADPTPNENYTVAGVTSGAPTPETSDAQAKKARAHQDEVQEQAEGVARNENK